MSNTNTTQMCPKCNVPMVNGTCPMCGAKAAPSAPETPATPTPAPETPQA